MACEVLLVHMHAGFKIFVSYFYHNLVCFGRRIGFSDARKILTETAMAVMMRSINTNKTALLCAGTTACGGVIRAYAVLIMCGGG